MWRKLADTIEKDIRAGRRPPGTLLPSLAELQRSGTGQTSAIAAFRWLDSKGLITKVPGKGTYVADVIPPPDPETDLNVASAIEDLRDRIDALERWREQHEQDAERPPPTSRGRRP